jgi:hypothetical protein
MKGIEYLLTNDKPQIMITDDLPVALEPSNAGNGYNFICIREKYEKA